MELLRDLFEHMLTEMQSPYINKYELLRSYVQIIIHEALKIEPGDTSSRPGTLQPGSAPCSWNCWKDSSQWALSTLPISIFISRSKQGKLPTNFAGKLSPFHNYSFDSHNLSRLHPSNFVS